MTEFPISKRDTLLSYFFGLCDLTTATIFALLSPKFYNEAVGSAGPGRNIAAIKLILIVLIYASAAGHFLRHKWGCTLYFIQFPLRLLTTVLSLSAVLYLIPYLGSLEAAAALHLAVVSLEWVRLMLTFGLRRSLQ